MDKSKKFISLCKKYEVDPEAVPEILSLEEAFKLTKRDIKKMPDVSMLDLKFQSFLISGYKTAVLTEAFNTDENGKLWIPNYNDSSEYKYEIWWNVKADKKHPSGSGLSSYVYGIWFTTSTVPACLCFKSRAIAIFVGKHFPEVFAPFQLMIK